MWCIYQINCFYNSLEGRNTHWHPAWWWLLYSKWLNSEEKAKCIDNLTRSVWSDALPHLESSHLLLASNTWKILHLLREMIPSQTVLVQTGILFLPSLGFIYLSEGATLPIDLPWADSWKKTTNLPLFSTFSTSVCYSVIFSQYAT